MSYQSNNTTTISQNIHMDDFIKKIVADNRALNIDEFTEFLHKKILQKYNDDIDYNVTNELYYDVNACIEKYGDSKGIYTSLVIVDDIIKKKLYIGKTNRSCKIRIKEHMYNDEPYVNGDAKIIFIESDNSSLVEAIVLHDNNYKNYEHNGGEVKAMYCTEIKKIYDGANNQYNNKNIEENIIQTVVWKIAGGLITSGILLGGILYARS